jgi:hypothetical protein
MERDIPMSLLRVIGWSSLCILLTIESIWATSPRALVLVTSAASSMPTLTTQEARKLFLGVPVEKQGVRPIPLVNISDSLTYEVFLQKVAFMSASAYETQTISVVFRLGGKRPEVFNDLNELVQALQQNPGTVSYLWEEQVRANQNLKTVNVLWRDSPD